MHDAAGGTGLGRPLIIRFVLTSGRYSMAVAANSDASAHRGWRCMDTNGHPSRLALGNPFRGPLQLAALLLLMSGSPTYAGPAPAPSKAPAPPETPQALMELAKRFQYGVGAPQNLDRAIQLFCRAADLGYAEAAYQLGWIYSTGRAGKIGLSYVWCGQGC